MEEKSITKTGQILKVMNVLAWIAVFLLVAEAGAILISYVISCVNPEGSRNVYMGLDLSGLMQSGFWRYTLFVLLMVAIPALKAFMVFQVTRTLSKVNLTRPFTMDVVRILERISYVLIGTWAIASFREAYAGWVSITPEQHVTEVSGTYLFMAGLVFIISQIFRRGVEIQSENELTV